MLGDTLSCQTSERARAAWNSIIQSRLAPSSMQMLHIWSTTAAIREIVDLHEYLDPKVDNSASDKCWWKSLLPSLALQKILPMSYEWWCKRHRQGDEPLDHTRHFYFWVNSDVLSDSSSWEESRNNLYWDVGQTRQNMIMTIIRRWANSLLQNHCVL